jgi:hypothetical protein
MSITLTVTTDPVHRQTPLRLDVRPDEFGHGGGPKTALDQQPVAVSPPVAATYMLRPPAV